MINKVGLLTPGNEELLPFAWNVFKRERDHKVSEGFRDTFSQVISVDFLGLWDTVSSVGWVWNPESLPFTAKNPIVKTVRHAVALDERRAYFRQNLWEQDTSVETDVLQAWFPSVHCDVGGGYAESQSGLSKIALKWMVKQAKDFGLRFDPEIEAVVIPVHDTKEYSAPNAMAMPHESLRGLWWICEVVPKRIKDPARNYAKRWIIPAGRNRYVCDNSTIQAAVLIRKSGRGATYNPPNLPCHYVEVE